MQPEDWLAPLLLFACLACSATTLIWLIFIVYSAYWPNGISQENIENNIGTEYRAMPQPRMQTTAHFLGRIGVVVLPVATLFGFFGPYPLILDYYAAAPEVSCSQPDLRDPRQLEATNTSTEFTLRAVQPRCTILAAADVHDNVSISVGEPTAQAIGDIEPGGRRSFFCDPMTAEVRYARVAITLGYRIRSIWLPWTFASREKSDIQYIRRLHDGSYSCTRGLLLAPIKPGADSVADEEKNTSPMTSEQTETRRRLWEHDRARMSFVRVQSPHQVDPGAAFFEAIFWFTNLGNGAASTVHAANVKRLMIPPDSAKPRICTDWSKLDNAGGTSEIGPGQNYRFSTGISPAAAISETALWISGTVEYIAGTDDNGIAHPDSLPFCVQLVHIPNTKAVRWLSCIGVPLPSCTVVPAGSTG